MTNSIKQAKDLFNIPGVEDLSCDMAANVQGGALLTLYKDINLSGQVLGRFNLGGRKRMSSRADNQVSSINISEGRWEFYTQSNWLSDSVEDREVFGPGSYNLTDYGLNDSISSFRRIG